MQISYLSIYKQSIYFSYQIWFQITHVKMAAHFFDFLFCWIALSLIFHFCITNSFLTHSYLFYMTLISSRVSFKTDKYFLLRWIIVLERARRIRIQLLAQNKFGFFFFYYWVFQLKHLHDLFEYAKTLFKKKLHRKTLFWTLFRNFIFSCVGG